MIRRTVEKKIKNKIRIKHYSLMADKTEQKPLNYRLQHYHLSVEYKPGGDLLGQQN